MGKLHNPSLKSRTDVKMIMLDALRRTFIIQLLNYGFYTNPKSLYLRPLGSKRDNQE